MNTDLKVALITITVLASGFLPVANADQRAEHHRERVRDIIEFETMYGVDGPFVNNAEVRGVLGDELPWSIASARGSLDSDGHLSLRVRGLVFKDDPSVPADIRGINDEESFRGLISCLVEEDDSVQERNVFTAPFRASRRGNARIRTTIELPNPCVAPIVFVMSGSEDKWFSVTGNEAEEEED